MKKGFTLIELLIIMGVMATISSFAVINLIRPQTKSSLDSTVKVLISDTKEQQLKAMIGDGDGGAASSYGIYFESGKYTLFKGSSYSPSDPNNFIVNVDSATTLSSTFTSNQVVFQQRSGEVSSFSGTNNTVTATAGGESKTLTINAIGTVSVN
jgi:prepilin-type N-terminal cleavage/methylation domain-containing protein